MGKSLRDHDGDCAVSPQARSRRRRIVGNYELGAILAIGDFDSYTQLCTYIPTGVSYVARIYDKALLAETHWMWERVRESVHVQRTISEHPNLIEMIECFETVTSLYIVMSMFSSISVVKLFVSHLTPSVGGASCIEGARAVIVERKHTCGVETPAKRFGSNARDSLPRDTRKGFRSDDNYEVYNCYDDSRNDSRGNEKSCFAPTLAQKLSEDIDTYDGKKAKQAILGREQDSPLELAGFCDSHARPARTHTPQLQSPSRPQESQWRARKSSCSQISVSWMHSAEGGHSESDHGGIAVGASSGDAPEGPIDAAFVRHIFLGVVHGVLHLHHHGVVHGGIAPDHVLYNPDRKMVKISNLISCYRVRRGSKRTELRGTRHSVAPEVLKQEPYDAYLTDAWSLGVLLYFMLNGGRYPHDGANTLKHILYHSIRPMRQSGIPASGADLVAHLLQPNPAERLTVEAILYHPFCRTASPLSRGNTLAGRAVADDEESAIRRDSLASAANFENSAASLAGLYGVGVAVRKSSRRSVSSQLPSRRLVSPRPPRDPRAETAAAVRVQRAFRAFRQRRLFRRATRALLEESSRRASQSRAGPGPSFRGRPRPPGRPFPAESPLLSHLESALEADVDANVASPASDPVLSPRAVTDDNDDDDDEDEDDDDEAAQPSGGCAARLEETTRPPPVTQHGVTLPPIPPSTTFVFPAKVWGGRAAQVVPARRLRPYDAGSPIALAAARLPGNGFRSDGGESQSSFSSTLRPLRHTASKPYANTSYEYRNGVFLPAKTR